MLHIDWLDYAEALLGPADWTTPASLAALYGKAQALWPSDLIALPVERVVTAHVARIGIAGGLTAAQSLRAVLADAGLRTTLNDMLARLDAVRGGGTVALALPAPAALAQAVCRAAGLTVPDANEDLADDAAVYLADFLRAFASAPVTALLFGGDVAFAAFDAPVLHVAEHYGWRVIRTPATGVSGTAIPSDLRPEEAAAFVARLRADHREPA